MNRSPGSRPLLLLAILGVLSPASLVADLKRAAHASGLSTSAGNLSPAATGAVEQKVRDAYGKLPLAFVPNAGQTDSSVRYSAQAANANFYFTQKEAVFAFRKGPAGETAEVVLRLVFVGANPKATIAGEDLGTGRVSYLLGSDPSRWRTALPTYRRVMYSDLWPGVDMVFRGDASRLKYEFILRPGARVEDIRLEYEGARRLSVDASGQLLIHTSMGALEDARPMSYQDIGGRRMPVESRFLLRRDTGTSTAYGFAVSDYDRHEPLVIDPGLIYSTYLGGTNDDTGNHIAVDALGNAYVTGETDSTFPTTTGAFSTARTGNFDVFVTKLNPSGSALVYSTYLGGSGVDRGHGIAVDASGNAYVTGETDDAMIDFPTTLGSSDTSHNGNFDVFVTKLNLLGSGLLYSTFVGGSGADRGNSIAIDASGNAYVTGVANAGFPTTIGAFDPSHNGGDDAFVTKLDSTGSVRLYSTYLGGTSSDIGHGIAVDVAGSAYVVGETKSATFPPTAGGNDIEHNGSDDVFVTKLNAAGSAPLVYSTFIGGDGNDRGFGIALDAAGSAYVTGETNSTGTSPFPTTVGAFSTSLGGSFDAFATKLSVLGHQLVYSTYLGGGASDSGSGIAVDAAGSAYVTGVTESGGTTPFPTTAGALDPSYNGMGDAFVTKLNAAGMGLLYSTYLGGSRRDAGTGIVLDAPDHVYLTGETNSSETDSIPFPTTAGAFDTTYGTHGDAFVTKLDTAPPPPVTVCGNGIVESGEACDQGAGTNGTPSSCCSATCTFKSSADVCRASAGTCDVAERCTGSSATCPADGFVSSGTVCRASADVCDVPESCTGSSAACPADGFASSGTVCRTSAGECDPAETCTGAAAACPLDARRAAGTTCADDGNVCSADVCDGINVSCQHPAGNAGVECRGSAGPCDLAEACSGVSTTCPDDAKASATLECRAAAGVCDQAEMCDGTSTTCPPDARRPSSFTCRAAVGECDVGETCDGSSVECPADAFRPGGFECRAPAGVCDTAEICNGTSAVCPADAKSTAECRAAAGDCDVAESCNGVANDCPVDGFKSPTEVCRASVGACDLQETCTGTGSACPADAKSTAECRASAGSCDVAESCDGTSDDCPADAFQPSSFECRASGGVCDPRETCTGSSAACPADAKSTAVCRTAAGTCDVPESCDGITDDCPMDLFKLPTEACRTSAGACDLEEKCTGTGPACPGDAKSTEECRSSAGACDLAERCDGTSNDCPADAFRPGGSECRAAAGVCDTPETCTGDSPACPADAKSTAECRGAAGACDAAESCDGVSNDCPADLKSTAECRPATGECDLAESCNGVDNDCPADIKRPPGASCGSSEATECDNPDTCDGEGHCQPNHAENGTPCDDQDVCTSADTCQGGECTAGQPEGCKVTGGGQINGSGGQASFGFNVHGGSGVKGQLEYHNHSSSTTFHSISIDSLAITAITCSTTGSQGKRATFKGTIRKKKPRATPDTFYFKVVAEDCGEPGRGRDTFSIWISNGDSNAGRLDSGNVQVR